MADGERAEGESARAPRLSFKPLPLELKVKRASAGLGLFAGEPIAKGACVIEYVGNMISEEQYQKSRSLYLFEVGKTGALDGSPRWNRARYINHSCRPNCEPNIRRRRVFIHAIREIAPGEELTYDYGSDYFEANIGENCRCIKCMPAARAKPRGAKNR